MALEIEMTNEDNGSIGNYHRISSIRPNHGTYDVEVVSYANSKFRDEEAINRSAYDRQIELGGMIYELCKVPPKERSKEDEAYIQELMAEQQAITFRIPPNGFHLFTKIYKIDASNSKRSIGEFTVSDIYNQLKNLDEFKGAKDV